MIMMSRAAIALSLGLAVAAAPAVHVAPAPAVAANPVVVLEVTGKGTFEMELFQSDAPKSVAHLLDLVKRGFYLGLRFHRVTPTLVQIGDPQTRNMRLENVWGTMGSGAAIGVAEISKTRKHVRGTVGLAHSGNPLAADSQIYIMKSASSPSLDGKHAIVGQVIKGMDVVNKLEKADTLRSVTIKAATPK
jgi:cyclophilin family peptidyl-prolyl cis-trans isomerase